MPQYVIEREIAGVGDLTSDDLKGISQKSCGILKDMGTGIEWVQSYVTGDKVYCVYNAALSALYTVSIMLIMQNLSKSTLTQVVFLRTASQK